MSKKGIEVVLCGYTKKYKPGKYFVRRNKRTIKYIVDIYYVLTVLSLTLFRDQLESEYEIPAGNYTVSTQFEKDVVHLVNTTVDLIDGFDMELIQLAEKDADGVWRYP